MPHVKVYLHFVWSTKNRQNLLSTFELRDKVWQHIRENAKQKGIYIDFIGGHKDHCHCLVSLGIEQTLKDLAQLIKGESSFWINKNKLCESHFNWQNDYFVVSESLIDSTRNYIKNQEEHHKTKSFEDEYNDFLEKHGFERFYD
jgi:putative transposase